MLRDKALEAVLRTASPFSFDSVVTRFVLERHRMSAGSPVGALRKGGRYNLPGIAALYTSFKRRTALEEFLSSFLLEDDDPLSATTMLSLIVHLQRVIDLTDAAFLAKLHTSQTELTSIRFPGVLHPAQRLGTIAGAMFDGLIVWSAAAPGEKNLVVYPEAHPAPPYVVVKAGREPR